MASLEPGGGLPRPPGATAPGGNPYGIPAPTLPTRPTFNYGAEGGLGEEDAGSLRGVFAALLQRMGGDEARAAAVFKRYIDEYNRGRAIQDPLVAEDQWVVGAGNLNPDDPRTFGRYAADARGFARQRDDVLAQLEEAGLSGGELEAAKAAAITGLSGRLADARAASVDAARNRLYDVSTGMKTGYSPGEDSGSAQALLGYYANKEEGAANRALQKYGIDTNRDMALYQGDRDYFLQKYGIDIGAAGQYRGQTLQDEQSKRMDALERAKMKANKPGFLGGLLGTLGGLAGTLLGGPAGGAIGSTAGGWLGGLFGKKGNSTVSGNSMYINQDPNRLGGGAGSGYQVNFP